jgi:hypothetical protein
MGYIIIAISIMVVSIYLNFYIYKNGLFGWDPYKNLYMYDEVHFVSVGLVMASIAWPLSIIAIICIAIAMLPILLYRTIFKRFNR